MRAELLAQIELVGEAAAPRDGWRGLIDFGEVWSAADTDLAWPAGSDASVGEPLVYGCEITHADAGTNRVKVRFIALDSLRPVMVPGARFTLRDVSLNRRHSTSMNWTHADLEATAQTGDIAEL